jgi:hypothetical protein
MSKTKKSEYPLIIILPKRTTSSSVSAEQQKRKSSVLTILFSLLALVALIHFIAVTHSASQTIVPMTCQGLLSTTDYTKIVRLQPQTQTMGAIQFVNQVAGGQPATLVQVTGTNAQQTLDAYVFGCATKNHHLTLTTLFAQHGLIQGTVSTSAANTLVTSTLDTSISPQNTVLEEPLQQNIYREYRWEHGAFVQITFPGLYPVTSRSEAEALQQQANSGQPLPWSDPILTAQQMAKDIFKWSDGGTQNTVLSNNGTIAQVQLVEQSVPMTVTVTLKRLIQQNKTGLWFVVAAQTSGITLNTTNLVKPIASPMNVTGSNALADGITTATIFDHTLTPLSLLNNPTLKVETSGNYSGSLYYSNAMHDQEGLVLVQSLPPSGSTEVGQLILAKVLLG